MRRSGFGHAGFTGQHDLVDQIGQAIGGQRVRACGQAFETIAVRARPESGNPGDIFVEARLKRSGDIRRRAAPRVAVRRRQRLSRDVRTGHDCGTHRGAASAEQNDENGAWCGDCPGCTADDVVAHGLSYPFRSLDTGFHPI
jgi:hypothetical protein